MTLLLGRAGFGEAPTRAIVCASDRISAGPRTTPGYPEPMADRLRAACVQLNAVSEKDDNIERAERLVARAARPDPRSCREPRRRRGDARHAGVGEAARDHAARRLDRRAP